jgi:LuxR family maltose regulon positive regulatory protein
VRLARLLRPGIAEDAIARPRLLEALDGARTRPLLLIATPAGYGKTTLLCQWLKSLDAAGVPAAWVTLDARTSDLAGVVAHVVAALRDAVPPDGDEAGAAALAALRLPGPPAPAVVADALAEGLLGLERDVVLVLDDYHAVADPAVHEFLGVLLEHPPPRLHLALATRIDPPLALARLRSQGQLVELRGADLRFDRAEATAFLGRALGAGAGAAAVALLEARTEGWAAGLRLAALALEPPPGAGGPYDGQPHRVAGVFGRPPGLVVEYLLDEVLARQPPAVQDFLLRVSIVERFCPPLCTALLDGDSLGAAPGVPDTAALLADVLRANLFVTPAETPRAPDMAPGGPGVSQAPGPPGEETPWFRLHKLFREVLRERLRARDGAGAVAALHARAGAWLASAGLVDEALTHLLAADGAEAAAALVEAHVHAALDAEDWAPLARWLGRLPDAQTAGRPVLLLARAWTAHGAGRYDAVPALLAAAAARLGAGAGAVGGPVADACCGEIDTLEALLHWRAGDAPGTLTRARRALRRLPEDRLLARGVAATYLGLSAAALEGSAPAVAELEALLAATTERASTFSRRVLTATAFVHLQAAALPESARVAQALLAPSDLPEPGRAWGHVVLGLAHLDWNDLEAAHHHFAAALARRHVLPFLAVREATLGLVLTLHAQGRRQAAAAAAADSLATALRRTGSPDQLAIAQACRVRLALEEGDADAAERWLRTTPAPDPSAAPAQTALTVPLTWALALLVSGVAGTPGRLEAALDYLGALRRAAAGTHQTRREIEVLALTARAAAAAGQPAAAAGALARALELAEPGGCVRPFLGPGPDLVPLLRQAAGAGGAAAAGAVRLLAVARREPDPGATGPAAGRGAPERGAGPLSAREAEVLACLARRLSNKEIARALNITVPTVKRHAASINAKLGAASRRDAVQRAVAAGLLPPPGLPASSV